MDIISYSLGEFQANCYFLIKNNHCLIIDPADEGAFILEELQRRKLKLVGILATHGHFDHLMAVGEIQLSFKVPLYINKKDRFLISRVEKSAEYFLGHKPSILPIRNIKNLNIKSSLKIENFKLKTIYTPGHTPGSACFYFPPTLALRKGVLFAGDTLFKQGIGSYDHSYSRKKDLYNSLKKLLKLPSETVVYPGYGDSTSIKEERNSLQLIKVD